MSTLAINPDFARSRTAVQRPVRPHAVPALVRPARPVAVRPAAVRANRPVSVRTAPAPLRLTRRGRLVVVLLMLGLMLVVLTAFGSHSAATGQAGTPVHTRTIEVGRGDTLWNIASRVSEPGQVRETVHQIEEINALTGPGLTVGQTIAVPVG